MTSRAASGRGTRALASLAVLSGLGWAAGSCAAEPDASSAASGAGDGRARTNSGGATSNAGASPGATTTGGATSGLGTGSGSGTGGSLLGVVATARGGSRNVGSDGTQPNCGSVKVDAQVETTETTVIVPGNVLFVFNQSGSMSEDWNGKAKWQAANDAVVGAFTPLKDQLSAGVVLFPSADADAGLAVLACDWVNDPLGCAATTVVTATCPEVAPLTSAPQMSIRPGPAFLSAWNAYWSRGAAVLAAGTPTEKGLLQAEAALATPPAGNTAVVLVTDGQPTCGANESAVATRLVKKGIKTYVVGLPGAAGSTVLDQVAIAGSAAPAGCTRDCYLSPADPAELQKALATIATTTVTKTTSVSVEDCTFKLSPPDDADPAVVRSHRDQREGRAAI